MQSLYKPHSYPKELRDQIAKLPSLATDILNRWMLGWPDRVKGLIEQGCLIELLKEQEQAEREAYSAPGNKHLARHEIAELYGLSAEPPVPTAPDQ